MMDYRIALLLLLSAIDVSGQTDKKLVLRTTNHSDVYTFSKPKDLIINGKSIKGTPVPLTINGNKIYSNLDMVNEPPTFISKDSFPTYLFNAIKYDLENLPDGYYKLDVFNMVVNTEGKLVFYNPDTLKVVSNGLTSFSIESAGTTDDVMSSIESMLNSRPPSYLMPSLKTTPGIQQAYKRRLYLSVNRALQHCPRFKPATIDGKPVNFLLDVAKYSYPYVYVVRSHKASMIKMKSN